MGCYRSKVENISSSLDEETTSLIEEYQKILRRKSEPIIHKPIFKRRRRPRTNSEPIDPTE
jgi:hypothetical protein